MKPKNRKHTLEEFLEWARRECAYIEIYTDGSAEVQMGPDFGLRTDSNTLWRALHKAHRNWLKRERRRINRERAVR